MSTSAIAVNHTSSIPTVSHDHRTLQKGDRASLSLRWHTYWSNFAKPRRDPAALSFARLGLLGTRW